MAKRQLEVLEALDRAKTQWYHFTAIVVAGMGFFTDAYDLFCISTVTKLLGRLYFYDASTGQPGTLPAVASSFVNGVALVGTLVGQLFFGWLGDKLGRKNVYGITLLLMVVSSIASALSFGSSGAAVIATLCFFRFWLGFGIGGDYPLSATIMAEYANTRTRGAFVAAVFAMQGFGILAGAAIAIVVSAIFDGLFWRPSFADDPQGSTARQADYVWRIIFVFGALPAAITYYWRLKMPETARYTALVVGSARQATEDMAKILQPELREQQQVIDVIAEGGTSEGLKESNTITMPEEPLDAIATTTRTDFGLFSKRFVRKHGKHLLATASCWFLLDIAFYSSNLFQKDVLSAIGWLPAATSMNAIEEVYQISRCQALIALCSTVPGYWATVGMIDRMGRVAIQLQGFFFMAALLLAIAIPYSYWQTSDSRRIGFIILYACTFFFSNFGPNATTFILPAELFPARFRSTCHGISAGAGKLGAIIGAFGFQFAWDSAAIGNSRTLIILASCSILGFFFTLLLPETKGRSLEEITGEMDDDEDAHQYLLLPDDQPNPVNAVRDS